MPKFQKINAVTKVVNRKFMLKLESIGILDLTIFWCFQAFVSDPIMCRRHHIFLCRSLVYPLIILEIFQVLFGSKFYDLGN
jgi:hypothetical protein